jgi:Family of unknown function (DUF6281)
MRRLLAIGVLTAAFLTGVASAPASPAAVCVAHVGWQSTIYKAVATKADIPVGRRLGTGVVLGCAKTNTSPPGYAAEPRVTVRRPLFAVAGIRTSVAVAMRGSSATRLFVSSAKATPAELRVLNRLRGR